MLEMGSARKVKTEGQAGNTWYIPNHGVSLPAKPAEIRVVVYCSADLGGTLLKKQLIAETHSTNQLIGVLTRFRKEHVAYMADIKAIFASVFMVEIW